MFNPNQGIEVLLICKNKQSKMESKILFNSIMQIKKEYTDWYDEIPGLAGFKAYIIEADLNTKRKYWIQLDELYSKDHLVCEDLLGRFYRELKRIETTSLKYYAIGQIELANEIWRFLSKDPDIFGWKKYELKQNLKTAITQEKRTVEDLEDQLAETKRRLHRLQEMHNEIDNVEETNKIEQLKNEIECISNKDSSIRNSNSTTNLFLSDVGRGSSVSSGKRKVGRPRKISTAFNTPKPKKPESRMSKLKAEHRLKDKDLLEAYGSGISKNDKFLKGFDK